MSVLSKSYHAIDFSGIDLRRGRPLVEGEIFAQEFRLEYYLRPSDRELEVISWTFKAIVKIYFLDRPPS
jgi:hypothetical protein